MDIKAFGDTVKKLREKQNKLQKDIAEQLSISSDYVSAIERGRRVPEWQVFIRLALALDEKPGDLLNILAGQPLSNKLVEVPEECNEEDIEAGLSYMRFHALERLKRQSSVAPEETPHDNVD